MPAFSTPFRTSTHLGPDINYVGAKPYWDSNASVISYPVGTKVSGSDGHSYILCLASANIAANTQVTITEPAFTAAAGSGNAYFTQATAPLSGQYFWARSTLP